MRNGAHAEVVVSLRSLIGGSKWRSPTTAPGLNGRGRTEGHTLVGMRERVALYGGTFEAGPTPTGVGCVHAGLRLIESEAPR